MLRKPAEALGKMIKIDWDELFSEYVIFGYHRFFTIADLNAAEWDNRKPNYSWVRYPWDLHESRPWHRCYKI